MLSLCILPGSPLISLPAQNSRSTPGLGVQLTTWWDCAVLERSGDLALGNALQTWPVTARWRRGLEAWCGSTAFFFSQGTDSFPFCEQEQRANAIAVRAAAVLLRAATCATFLQVEAIPNLQSAKEKQFLAPSALGHHPGGNSSYLVRVLPWPFWITVHSLWRRYSFTVLSQSACFLNFSFCVAATSSRIARSPENPAVHVQDKRPSYTAETPSSAGKSAA